MISENDSRLCLKSHTIFCILHTVHYNCVITKCTACNTVKYTALIA